MTSRARRLFVPGALAATALLALAAPSSGAGPLPGEVFLPQQPAVPSAWQGLPGEAFLPATPPKASAWDGLPGEAFLPDRPAVARTGYPEEAY